MSGPCPEIVISGTEKQGSENPVYFNRTDSSNSVNQTCSVISVSPVMDRTSARNTSSSVLSSNDVNIPEVTIHRESPALIRRNFYSGIVKDFNVSSSFVVIRLIFSNYSKYYSAFGYVMLKSSKNSGFLNTLMFVEPVGCFTKNNL